jgi:uncharacterized protein
VKELSEQERTKFEAGLDGVTFFSNGSRLLGGFYKAAGETPRPTAVLLHGLPGIEKNLDIAYALRDMGWNCLYFHFRGSWGSQGEYSLPHLTEDTHAAVQWVREQPSVDKDSVVLIGASTGSYPALLCAATDRGVRGVVALSPVIVPSAFRFPESMAEEFAAMLNGVTGLDLVKQWEALEPLSGALEALAPRPLLLIAAEKDGIFPPRQYEGAIGKRANIRFIRHPESDHGFSTCRRWLVKTVTDFLDKTALAEAPPS